MKAADVGEQKGNLEERAHPNGFFYWQVLPKLAFRLKHGYVIYRNDGI